MAAEIDAEVGGASSNSYQEVEEADAYFEDTLQAADWALVSDKEAALITACWRMEQETYQGDRVSSTQALSFPRTDMVVDGVELSSETIPAAIKRAQAKLALILYSDDSLLDDTGLEGFKRVKVGPLEVEPNGDFVGGDLPADVLREIQRFLEGGSLFQFKIARG